MENSFSDKRITTKLSLSRPLKYSNFPDSIDALLDLFVTRGYSIEYFGEITRHPKFYYHRDNLSCIPLSLREIDEFWQKYQEYKRENQSENSKHKVSKTFAEIIIEALKYSIGFE